MSQQPLLVTGEALADASADALLATAHALLRVAAGKAREGTVGVSREELIDQALTYQQVQNTAWAAQSVRLAQVVAIEEVVEAGKAPRHVRHPVGTYTDEWLPSEISTRLGWPERQTTDRLTEAVEGMRYTPRMFARALAGGLDPRKLNVVSDTLAGADAEVAKQVEDELLSVIAAAQPDADDNIDDDDELVSMTSTKLVRRARRLLAEAAPAAAEKAAAASRVAAMGVRAFPHHEPGLSVFRAVLPTDETMRVMAAINELARQLHEGTTTGKTMDECRVDAFADLLLGNASVSTTCVVQIPFLPTEAGPEPNTTHGDTGADNSGPDKTAPGRTRGGEAPTGKTAGDHPADDLDAELAELIRIATDAGFEAYAGTDPALRGDRAAASVGSGARTRFMPALRLRFREPGHESQQRWDPGSEATAGPHDRGRDKPRAADPPRPCTYPVGDVVFEGLGVIPARVLTQMCHALGTTMTRALVDMHTGATIETADQTYKPGARLRRFIITRDQHCRFPQCTRPARLDDVDHVIRYPDGPTAAWNLQCLCKHHHRAKHEGGWRVSMTPDGVCTWTSPSGRHYVTHPDD